MRRARKTTPRKEAGRYIRSSTTPAWASSADSSALRGGAAGSELPVDLRGLVVGQAHDVGDVGQLGQAEVLGKDLEGVPRRLPVVAGSGQFLPDLAEHPGVADLGGVGEGDRCAGAAVAFQGAQLDVGRQRAGEVRPRLLGVGADVAGGHHEQHAGQDHGGADRHHRGIPMPSRVKKPVSRAGRTRPSRP